MNAGLTTFRALAFLAVFFFHAGVFQAGYLGVQAFFVLSGFLLTPILCEMKKELAAKSFFVNFYGRRALRIFPLYYLYLLSVGVISLIISSIDTSGEVQSVARFLDQFPWALSYCYDFFHATTFYEHTPLLSHFWSLAVEEQFYLLWPCLIFFVNSRHLKAFLLLVIAAGPVVRFLTIASAASGFFPVLASDYDLIVYVLPFSHVDAFAIGAYVALYQSCSSKWTLPAAIAVVLLVGFGTQYLATGDVVLSSLGYSPFMKGKAIWAYSVLNLLFALTLLQLKDARFLPVLFENRTLHYLGTISYGLYVFHLPVLWSLSRIGSSFLWISTSLLLTVVLSAASYELIEKRLIRKKDVYFPKR